MKKFKMILFLLVLIVFSCENLQQKNSDVFLSNEDLFFLKQAAECVIETKIDTSGCLSLDSFVICNEFDLFSIERFYPKSDSIKIRFLKRGEEKVNEKFFGKVSSQLSLLSSCSDGTRVLSFSGFSDGFVMIAYYEVGKNTFSPCSIDPNHVKNFFVEKKGATFVVIAELEYFLG